MTTVSAAILLFLILDPLGNVPVFLSLLKPLPPARQRLVLLRELSIALAHLLPNVVIPMGALALLGMAVAIVAEGALAFLGLSVENGITWGKLILFGSGPRELESAYWIAFSPIIVLFLTVAALNFAGDKLRAHFDVKEAAI